MLVFSDVKRYRGNDPRRSCRVDPVPQKPLIIRAIGVKYLIVADVNGTSVLLNSPQHTIRVSLRARRSTVSRCFH